MRWDIFYQVLREADRKFQQVLLDLPQHQQFLNKSTLSITVGAVQFPFKKELTIVDLKSMERILKESVSKETLLRQIALVDSLEFAQKSMQNKKTKEEVKKISEDLERARNQLASFPLQELDIVNEIGIRIIFPYVSVGAIQEVKEHPLIISCPCRACICAFICLQR